MAAQPSWPLLVHVDPAAPFASRHGRIVTAAQFVAQARALAERLEADQILNLCTDRYHFAVGLAAALIAGKPSLLASAHAPAAIRASSEGTVLCLADAADVAVSWPTLRVDAALLPAAGTAWQVPRIDATQRAVQVFTSGSTAAPVPHAKSWGSLVTGAQALAQQLELRTGPRCLIVSTVPAPHMFGLEATVMLPMHSGHLLCDERPFFPADVVARLAALPAPRILVTTPVHLNALLGADLVVPALDRVVVSTAPLAQSLAQRAEQRLQCPLLEIYGSTESGQIAVRRTSVEREWRLSPDLRIELRGQQAWVTGGHVEIAVPLADRIELLEGQRFLLQGRQSDQVNIAGKRSSLGYLNHQLASIPGVLEAVFFHPAGSERESVGDARLAAAVVAPGCSSASIAAELRRRIDAAFMPRPLLLVDRLPRDANGKIPREQLQALRAAHGLP